MIAPRIVGLCQNGKSVSQELAANPSDTPKDAAQRLFHEDIEEEFEDLLKEPKHGAEDLKQAAACGNWGGAQPSDFFLKVYHDVLCALERHPVAGVCSPSLLGSHGTSPLGIIAPLPDICRHMSNLIARAEHEVFLATNYWMHSEASTLITNGLRELSIRMGQKNSRAVVKVLYDRGSAKQIMNNHLPIQESEYSDPKGPVRLPAAKEIPNIDLEVINYHKPPLGTFHAKFMIVDRKIAIMQSDNIQDNDNVEMMSQVEGPIVDSIYDMALISWHNKLNPTLPCLTTPAAQTGYSSFNSESYQALFDADGNVGQNVVDAAKHKLPEHTSKDPHYDVDIADEYLRCRAVMTPINGERQIDVITRHLNTTIQSDTKGSAPDLPADVPQDAFTPMIPVPPHAPFPIAMVNRPPHANPFSNPLACSVPQNAAFLSVLRHATREVFIQTPDLNAKALIPALLACVRRKVHVIYYVCLGYNDAGELLPMQNGTNEMIAHQLYKELEPELHEFLDIYNYVGKDQIRPIHNLFKQRSCHIKLLIADRHLGIQGSGNQDTQSWMHSQEGNIMIDSELVCEKWLDGIRRNQNTHLYGKVQKSGEFMGCWVDPETGKMAEKAMGNDTGRFSWAKGVTGAINRARGVGGF